MLRSMTGYGRGEAAIGGRRIVFEIKSVNHFSSSTPALPGVTSFWRTS